MWCRKNGDIPTCPRTGKPLKSRIKNNWARWLFPITGLLATIWFIVRVIPKPSRATYPCQRVAFPFASSFIAYILGLFGTGVALRKARRRLRQSRFVLAGICIFVGLACSWLTISINSEQAGAAFTPSDLPNRPIGVGKGIFPGRVVWAYDPDATYWDPGWNNRTDIYYWDDDHTDPEAVEIMMSTALRWLSGEPTDERAWEALFRHFNQTHGRGDVGYTPGEKIAIKPNCVENRQLADYDNHADLSPQIVVGLLKQLVWEAGVPENCITICDSSRYFSDKFFTRCHALFPDITYNVTNYFDAQYHTQDDRGADPNRPSVLPSPEPMIFYSVPGTYPANDQLPMPFVEADYMINLAKMKRHGSAGVTLTGKNWYGSFCRRPGSAQHYTLPNVTAGPGNYRLMVDLMGHEHLGGKTMLFILDGLWGFPNVGGSGSGPMQYEYPPFNGDYPSSIFMSQDHVAIDSVGLDFVRTALGDNMNGTVDDYLHEAAQADAPPSGTFYDPEADAIGLQSLGVHEHWNNYIDKKYSRNLGTGEGIELISPPMLECTEQITGDADDNCEIDFEDLRIIASDWLDFVPDAPIDILNGDFDPGPHTWHFESSDGYIPSHDTSDGVPAPSVRIDINVPATGWADGVLTKIIDLSPYMDYHIPGNKVTISFYHKGDITSPTTTMFEYRPVINDSTLFESYGDALISRIQRDGDTTCGDCYGAMSWDWELYTHTMPADARYLHLYFSLAGDVDPASDPQRHVNIDTVRVVHNSTIDARGNLNGDNTVDFKDFAIMANDWPKSNLMLMSDCPVQLEGDINNDCRVDNLDLYQIINSWLCDGYLYSDLDNSGHVDMNDFAIMANDWREIDTMPLVFWRDFEDGSLAGWQPTDPAAWQIEDEDDGHHEKVLSLFQQSVYYPPIWQSPKNINLIDGVEVGSFILELDALSTTGYYTGRDLCLIFGHQDAAHFYYAHIADTSDYGHNTIHIVNGAPRFPIADYRNSGNSWEGGWHHLKLVRNIDTGKIEVYFDDMAEPAMTATDSTFGQGKVGIGSFDDTGKFDNIMLWGQ